MCMSIKLVHILLYDRKSFEVIGADVIIIRKEKFGLPKNKLLTE